MVVMHTAPKVACFKKAIVSHLSDHGPPRSQTETWVWLCRTPTYPVTAHPSREKEEYTYLNIRTGVWSSLRDRTVITNSSILPPPFRCSYMVRTEAQSALGLSMAELVQEPKIHPIHEIQTLIQHEKGHLRLDSKSL